MVKKDNIFNLCLGGLTLLAVSALVLASRGAWFSRLDAGIAVLIVLVVALGSYLKAHLQRLDLHLALSSTLVVVTMYVYGGQAAVFAAAVECTATMLVLKRLRSTLEFRDIAVGTATAVISAAAAWGAVQVLFSSPELVIQRHETTSMIWFVTVSVFALFAVNALVGWALFKYAYVPDPRRSVDEVLSKIGLSFLIAEGAAGLAVAGLEQMNLYVIAGITAFFGLIYWTYRRYLYDVRSTAERARSRERIRAEAAEQQVRELSRYVEELETSSETLRESHERFRHAAYHDALTGLPNRNYFIDTLKALLRDSRERTDSNFAILLLDLNRFKTINDSLGHSMGDKLIKHVAKRVSLMVREGDMVARFSGDKFGIILSDLIMQDEAKAFAERLIKRVAEPYTLDDRQVFTSVKIGIAFGNSKYQEAEDILRDADIAMYYAKDNNENQVIFDQKMHVRAVTRMQLETDLRFAIERNEFELYYQPIIGLGSASLVGFEALVRWNHPQRGLVPPNEFIPISENTGLIVPMTIQILHSACAQVARWQRSYPSDAPLSVAVNLSGKHFAHPNLPDQINDVLRETGLGAPSLKLELTESAVMENAETAILMLKQIKETGVQISIDDFGTGYSSLSYLHRFPIDLLKVDRSFVSAMEENSENGEIVRTVIALAKALKLKVVAEGIESIHQFHQLRILGCEYGQGYLFSKPLPIAEIEKLLQDGGRWRNILPAHSRPIIPQNAEMPQLRLTR